MIPFGQGVMGRPVQPDWTNVSWDAELREAGEAAARKVAECLDAGEG